MFIGLLTVTFATHNVYHVQPDDVCKEQPSETCHTLQFFINHSDLFFKSNSIFVFGEGNYFHSKGDLTVQNVANLSMIGKGSSDGSVVPGSVINCLPHHHIHFYNVVNLLIQTLIFDQCGSSVGLLTKRSGYGVVQDYYWASIFFDSCIHLQVVNVIIFDPVGYAIVGYNVIGNNSLNNVTVTITKDDLYTLPTIAYSLAIHWSYDGRVISEEDIYFSINDFKLIDHSQPHICIAKKSMIKIQIYHSNAYISISNASFSSVETYNSVIQIEVDSSSQSRIKFHNCVVNFSILSHFLEFHYSDNFTSINNSTKYYPRVTVTFVQVSFLYNTHALANGSNSILLLTSSSKCSEFKLDIMLTNVLFEGNILALLRVMHVSDFPKLNHHYSISISTEGYFIVQYNDIEYSDSLILLTNGQIQFNGNTTFTKNYASQLISLSDAQMRLNGITKIFATIAYELISLINGQLHFTGQTDISYNNNYQLLLLSDAQVHFNGSTRFINNNAIEIIRSSSSLLNFSNCTLF